MARTLQGRSQDVLKFFSHYTWLLFHMLRCLISMPEDCQFLTIKQLLRIEEDEERDKMVKNWAVDQKSMLQYVTVAGTLVASVVTSSLQWPAVQQTHWTVPTLWYGSLLLSLFCVIIAIHLSIFLGAYDTRSDGPEALVKMLRKNTGDGQRWQSRTLLRTPVTLFSWAIISYVVGLGVLVFRPLWTVAFGDSGRIAIGALAYAVVTVGIYFGVGISIYGKYLPELEVPDDEVDQRTRKRQKFSTQQPQNIERV